MPTDMMILNLIIEFYPIEHGGRKVMPDLTTGTYRPHIVAQADPEQTYLGVEIKDGPNLFVAGEEIAVRARPLFDAMEYSGLTRGVTFLIIEGHHTVGQGVVL